MKIMNRIYTQRCRAKKTIARLKGEKTNLECNLRPAQQNAIEIGALKLKIRLIEESSSQKILNDEDKRNMDIKVLKYEIAAMKEKIAENTSNADAPLHEAACPILNNNASSLEQGLDWADHALWSDFDIALPLLPVSDGVSDGHISVDMT